MFWSVVRKSYREQIRSYWILLLTVSMAPFFVAIYYMINESMQESYKLLIVNQDQGVIHDDTELNRGDELIVFLRGDESDSLSLPLRTRALDDRSEPIQHLEDGKADALVVIPDSFSRDFLDLSTGSSPAGVPLEIVGDLTRVGYMVTAIWADELITEYVHSSAEIPRPLRVTETSLGQSGEIDEFDYYMPGIMILAVIMLMFSATIAIITEVDQKTILRLKISKLSATSFLSGVGLVQILVGLVSILLTLAMALSMGFDMQGSFWLFLLLAVLTSVSIIAFSLLLAAFTRSVNEVLIIGNFPLFLFMFFTGAAFPMSPKTLFYVGDHAFGWNGFMSASHAFDALRKVMVMNKGIGDIVPEILAIILCTIAYFILGVWAFQRRHLRVD